MFASFPEDAGKDEDQSNGIINQLIEHGRILKD